MTLDKCKCGCSKPKVIYVVFSYSGVQVRDDVCQYPHPIVGAYLDKEIANTIANGNYSYFVKTIQIE